MLLHVERGIIRQRIDSYFTESNNIHLVKHVLQKNLFLPVTLAKATLYDSKRKWTSTPTLYKPGTSAYERVKYTFGNFNAVGLDEPLMTDQPDADKIEKNIVHEITYEEVCEWMDSKEYQSEGTLWNVLKKYSAFFIRKEVRDKVLRDFGIDLSLVYPSADCAVVRFYDEKEKVMGIAHVDAKYAGKNLIKDCVDFAKTKFGINPKNMYAFVNAFASRDYTFVENAPSWAVLNGVDTDGYPVLNSAWQNYIKMHREDGVLISEIDYKKKIQDQLEESGITKDHTSFSEGYTIGSCDHFSNSDFAAEVKEFKAQKQRELEVKFGAKIKDINVEKVLKALVDREKFNLPNCGRDLAVAAFPLDNHKQPTKLYRRAANPHFYILVE